MQSDTRLLTAVEKHAERTLVVIKPEAVQRGIAMEILSRFERVGLKIVALAVRSPTRDFAKKHYTYEDIATRHGETVWKNLLDYITEGPVVAAVLGGVEAISVVRKICGSTESAAAAPGTIRGDYSHQTYAYCDEAGIAVRNVVHASASREEAAREISLWFEESDIQEV